MSDGVVVNAYLFGRLLRKVEALADVDGWHRDPAAVLYVVYDRIETETVKGYERIMRGGGPPTMLGTYVARPILGDKVFRDAYMDRCLEAWDVVTNFAENVAFSGDEQVAVMADVLRQPGVLGFAFRGEGYRNDDGRETLVRAVFGEFHLGDLPTSTECRMVYGHDVEGRQYRTIRERGGMAESETPETRDVWRGDFSTALALLVDVVNGTVPTPKDYRRRYPTLRETFGGKR